MSDWAVHDNWWGHTHPHTKKRDEIDERRERALCGVIVAESGGIEPN